MKIIRLLMMVSVFFVGLLMATAPCFGEEDPLPAVPAVTPVSTPETAGAPGNSAVPEAPVPGVAETSGPLAEVKAVHLNMRAVDNSNGTIVRVASAGETFPILEKKGDWLKVTLPTGALVFIRRDCVKIDGSAVTVTRAAPLLAAPSPSAPVMGEAAPEDTFELVQEHGAFVKVRSRKESFAWVATKHVTVHGTIPGAEAPLAVKSAVPVTVAGSAPAAGSAAGKNFSPAGMTATRSVTWQELRSEIERMDQQVQQQLADAAALPSAPVAAAPAPEPAPDFLFTGYMREAEFSPVKKVLPFQYRLTKGGREICALSSTKFALRDFVGKMVGVTGYYEDNPYSRDKILVVTGMTVLE